MRESLVKEEGFIGCFFGNLGSNLKKPTMQKLFVVAACLFVCACSQKQDGNESSSVSFTDDDVRSAWIQLTFQDGKWVIFEPCEASNLKLYWKGDSLTIEWGQFATIDVIHRLLSDNQKFTLEGVDSTSNPPNHTFLIEPVDSVPGLARWWLMDEKEPRLLVKESVMSNYPTVKESCEGLFEDSKK
jgi:hypothetical protein